MDPAGPVFDVEPEFAPKMRLYPGDAQFVDVIHTNGWDWIELGIGQKSGDVDFYVNGGGDQPGCDGAILVIYSFYYNYFIFFFLLSLLLLLLLSVLLLLLLLLS